MVGFVLCLLWEDAVENSECEKLNEGFSIYLELLHVSVYHIVHVQRVASFYYLCCALIFSACGVFGFIDLLHFTLPFLVSVFSDIMSKGWRQEKKKGRRLFLSGPLLFQAAQNHTKGPFVKLPAGNVLHTLRCLSCQMEKTTVFLESVFVLVQVSFATYSYPRSKCKWDWRLAWNEHKQVWSIRRSRSSYS